MKARLTAAFLLLAVPGLANDAGDNPGGNKPACDVAHRGWRWHVYGGAGVADSVEVCRKDASDAYAWVALDAPAGEGGGSPCDAYPVGALHISTVSTNPGTSLGCGTWSAFGAGRVLVGIDAGQTEFDTGGETGGAKTHTLQVSEMPAHSHVQDAHTHVQNSHNHTQDAHTHVVTSQTATTGSATSYEHGTLDTSSAEAEATEVTGSTTATNQAATATNQNATAVNQSTGGGGAHSILNPYVVVFFWKRDS